MFTPSATLDYYSKRNVMIWLTMTFQAGAINAGTFLSCGKFVTHTTGLATNIGTEFAQGSLLTAAGVACIPVFYMGGAMISAFFIDYRIQSGRRPFYPAVMGLAFFVLTAVFIGGVIGRFGAFGGQLDIFRHFILLISLALTSGMLNGTVTSACGAVIRITHMTGLTTDLGIGLVRVLTRSHKMNSRQNEIQANLIRVGIFSCFVLGALASTFLYMRFHYWGFILPCLLSLVLFAWSLFRYSQSKAYIKSQNSVAAS